MIFAKFVILSNDDDNIDNDDIDGDDNDYNDDNDNDGDDNDDNDNDDDDNDVDDDENAVDLPVFIVLGCPHLLHHQAELVALRLEGLGHKDKGL